MAATPRYLGITKEEMAMPREVWEKYEAEKLAASDQPLDTEGNLRLYTMEQMANLPKGKWLINQIVEEQGLTVLFGPDKAGKTILLSSFLWAWASGRDWFFDRTFTMNDGFLLPQEEEEQGATPLPPRRVLYILAEGQGSFFARFAAWKEHNDEKGLLGESFITMPTSMSMFGPNTGVTPDQLAAEKLIARWRPHIVVVDTFSRVTGGMNENTSEVAKVVSWFDYLRDEYGCATIVVTHVALDANSGDRPRGHSSLKGAASSYVLVHKKDDSAPVARLRCGPHRNAVSENPKNADQSVGWYFNSIPWHDAFYIERGDPPKGGPKGTETDALRELVPCTPNKAAKELGKTVEAVRQLYRRAEDMELVDGMIVFLEAEEAPDA